MQVFATLVVLCSLACASSIAANDDFQPDIDSTYDISTISNAWRIGAEQTGAIELSWRQATTGELDRFSHYRSYWVGLDGARKSDSAGPVVSTLQIVNETFRYQTERWTYRQHQVDHVADGFERVEPVAQYNELIPLFEDARNSTDFTYALNRKFETAGLECRDPQPFTRVFDGRRVVDHWHRTNLYHPRIMIRRIPKRGSAAWATLVLESAISDRVDTLNLFAAMIGLRRLSNPTIGFVPDNLRILDTPQIVNGRNCVVVEERDESNPVYFRTFWVDPANDFVVRRFMGTADQPVEVDWERIYGRQMPIKFGSTLIDIEYVKDEELGWIPDAWTVFCAETSMRPVRAFTRSKTQAFSRLHSQNADRITSDANTNVEGAWVIDDQTPAQYIVRSGGEKRIISDAEIVAGATYDYLAVTEPGKYDSLQYSGHFVRKMQLTIAAIGCLLLLASAAFCFKRRQSQHLFSSTNGLGNLP